MCIAFCPLSGLWRSDIGHNNNNVPVQVQRTTDCTIALKKEKKEKIAERTTNK
jgi:hypothetical protein